LSRLAPYITMNDLYTFVVPFSKLEMFGELGRGSSLLLFSLPFSIFFLVSHFSFLFSCFSFLFSLFSFLFWFSFSFSFSYLPTGSYGKIMKVKYRGFDVAVKQMLTYDINDPISTRSKGKPCRKISGMRHGL
jgi:hypothetical protein